MARPENQNVYIEPKVASVPKRIAAFFIDLVIFVLLLTGVMALVGEISGYNKNAALLEEKYVESGVYVMDEEIKDYVFCDTELQECRDSWTTFFNDEVACEYYDKSIELTTFILTTSILVSYLVLEFIVPLLFKNGQTLGMRLFGIGLVSSDGVRISTKQLFIRFLFGKFLVVTMIPIYCIIYTLFSYGGLIGFILMLIILGIDLLMTLFGKNKAGIANSLGSCYACDLDASMIYDTIEEVNYIKGEDQKRRNEKVKYF